LKTKILLAIAAGVSFFFMQATPTIAGVATFGITVEVVVSTVVTASITRGTIWT
jgi:uncharacterized protein YqfA (UPF0365 family)